MIDKQHKELFRMVEHLLNVVQSGASNRREECISAISFLKKYVIQHFQDEEAFQKSINYSGMAEHVKIHKRLIQEVLKHERKMVVSKFSMTDIRDFVGMLIAWLVCHVAGDDQLIVKDKAKTNYAYTHSPINNFFYMSTCDIISKVTAINMKNIKVVKLEEGDFQPTVSVSFRLNGDVSGTVSYNYTKELAFNLMKSMASFSPYEVDEIVKSAMMEISDFTIVKSIGWMSERGITSKFELPNVNTMPAFIPSQDSIILDTGIGVLEIDIALV